MNTMRRARAVGLWLGWITVARTLAATGEPGSGAAGVTPSGWVPDQAVVCLELTAPGRLIEPLLAPDFVKRVAALPTYERWRSSREIQDLLRLTRYLEQAGQADWPALLRKLTGRGVALAVGGVKRSLLVIEGADPELLGKLNGAVRDLAAGEAQRQGQASRVHSQEYAGVTGWTFDGKEAHAIAGSTLLVASDAGVLKAAIDLREASAGSLAATAAYQAARRAVGAGAAGLLFVDLEKLRLAPGFLAGLDGARDNPLAALLFAGVPAVLKTAPWLALGVYVDGPTLSLRAFLGGTGGEAGRPAFVGGEAGAAGIGSETRVPRGIAELSLRRDLAKFYAAKDDLFPQRTSGLIFFENMMGIFFSGRNLTEDVLAQTTPDVRIVVARQEYDAAIGTPDPQWPAFAVVFGLREPARFGEVLEEAWQKALGLINFTRGQKAQPGLILDRAQHRGTPISVARFSAKDVADRQHLDPRFNLRPTLAIAGDRAILSSTDGLARDLMDAFAPGPAAPASAPAVPVTRGHTRLGLAGKELAAALTTGRAAMVRDNMLKEGHSQPEAEVAVDTLIELVGWVDRVTLCAGGEPNPALAELRMSFRGP
jgi:hypothetical protein